MGATRPRLEQIAGDGTAAGYDVPASGNAAAGEVVLGSDTRLSDARTPVAHNQAWSTITSTPTTMAGYGITDYNSLGDARYLQLTGGALAGPLTGTGAVVEFRDSTTAQTVKVFRTWADVDNNEYFQTTWSGTTCYLQTQKAGTGTVRDIEVRCANYVALRTVNASTQLFLLNDLFQLDNGDGARIFGVQTLQNNSAPIHIRSAGGDGLKVLHGGGVTIDNSATPDTVATLTLNARGTQLAPLFSAAGFQVSGAGTLVGPSNVLAVRNSTNAQTVQVYGTYSGAGANYVRSSLSCTDAVAKLAAESGGDGAADVNLVLAAKGAGYVSITQSFNQGLALLLQGASYGGGNSGDPIFRIKGFDTTNLLTVTADGQLRIDTGSVAHSYGCLVFGNSVGLMYGLKVSTDGSYCSIHSDYGGNNMDQIQIHRQNGEVVLVAGGSLVGFGGKTSSNPALKPNGTTLQVRLANDGDYTNLKLASLELDGQSARSATVARNVTSNTAGVSFTLQAGGATTGATDKNGGYLDLIGGTSTGTGASGVRLKGYAAGGTGTADNSASTVIEVLGNKLGFFGATPVVQQSALTAALTNLTHTAPGTPDYTIATLTDTGGFGFTTADEGHTVLSVIANLQARVNELETILTNLGITP